MRKKESLGSGYTSSAMTASDLADTDGRFSTTLWSEVRRASDPDPERRRAALDALAQAYWPPLYALARRRGLSPEDAQDAVQEFFSRLIEKDSFASADESRGRFRTWIRAAFAYFLADAHDHRTALKRGGGRIVLTLDPAEGERYFEPADPSTPERHFDRAWARLLIHRAMDLLRQELAGDHFELLRETLGAEKHSMKELADRFGLMEHDVKNRLFRARRRLREIMLAEIRNQVDSSADAERELRDLGSALS
jgi:RNA polymerase sigma factor (sigma-70 family)